jgi:ABC-type sugar transport system, permease component
MSTPRRSRDVVLFDVLGYSLVTIVAILCLLPLLLLVSGSLTSETEISQYGYSLVPRHLSTAAYSLIFRYPADVIRAYGISIFITFVGSLTGLLVITMAAYVINRKEFRYRNGFAFFFYFVTLFNGGLVSTYIFMIRYLHLKNSLLALILPLLMNVFYLLIMRSFMKAIPESVVESARIEGAGDFAIFRKLVLPLSKPALATIGLFLALDYWNDWSNAMLYITDYKKFPLQYMLYSMLSATEAISRISAASSVPIGDMPSQSLKLAMAVVATGPIVLAYPAVQKYFVKGITVGAVKG